MDALVGDRRRPSINSVAVTAPPPATTSAPRPTAGRSAAPCLRCSPEAPPTAPKSHISVDAPTPHLLLSQHMLKNQHNPATPLPLSKRERQITESLYRL